jgi:hypothetical protein
LQSKLDKIASIWVEVAELQREKNQENQIKIGVLLNESSVLLEEIKSSPSKNLPKKLGWLSPILSTTDQERNTLLTKEIQERRWCLPWKNNSNGQDAGTSVLIQNVISKATEAIRGLRAQNAELQDRQQQLQDEIERLKLDIKILGAIYSTAKNLIDILEYNDEELVEFTNEYDRYMKNFSLPRNSFLM